MTKPQNQPDALEPLRKTLTVPLRPKDAFHLFTERMGEWWPLDSHSLSAAEGNLPRKLSVEPREGGQIIETKPDGSKAPWARITCWQPGAKFALNWHVGADEEEATQVSVVFLPVDTGTQIELTHTGFGAEAETASAAQDRYAKGWDHILGLYLAKVKAYALTL